MNEWGQDNLQLLINFSLEPGQKNTVFGWHAASVCLKEENKEVKLNGPKTM